ncbi:MAG: GumC family protein [Marinifilaceae bacterium]
MQQVDELMEYFEERKQNNTKDFLLRLLSKWHYFVLFGILGVSIGFVVNSMLPPQYRTETSLLINEDSKGLGLESIFDKLDFNSKTNISKQVGVLKSYTINQRALKNLDWAVSWYKKEWFKSRDLYGNPPLVIKQHEGERNVSGIPVYVTPLSNHTFNLRVDGKVEINGNEVSIKINKNGIFGKPFRHKYFHFTLGIPTNKTFQKGEEYFFIINDLNKMTIDYMEKLNVSLAEKNAGLIRMQLIGEMPNRCVDYLNELNWVFLQFGLQEKNRISENTMRFINAQLQGIVDSLQMAGQSFSSFRSRNRTMNLGQEASLVVEKLEGLETNLATAEMRLKYYKNLHRYLENEDQMQQVVAPSVVGITDPSLNTLVIKLTEMYGKREVLRYSVHDKNPSLVLLNNEILHIRRSLEEILGNMMTNAEVEVESLEKRMEKIKTQLATLPKTEQELINIKRRFDLNNELYTYLLKKRAEAAITNASNVPDARVLDPAQVGTAKKVGPIKAVSLLVGLLLGMGIPFLVFLIKDFFNDTIQNREDLEKESQLPVLGSIVHNRRRMELPVVEYPRSEITECFRSLRTSLQFQWAYKANKVIAVLSTIPGEGKSFVAMNLSAILALGNKKVLLVGADLRKPRLQKVFQCSEEIGLSTYLCNQHTFEEVLCSTDIKNLDFIPSGPIPPDPAELLNNGKFEKFIEQGRKLYDYVVLDSTPVSLVTDGILAGRFADSNLFMIRRGYSRKEQVKMINRIARQGAVKKVGLVLNDVLEKKQGKYRKYGVYSNGKGYFNDKPLHHIQKERSRRTKKN